MEAIFTANNVGARVRIYEKYITIKNNIFWKDVTIPYKEISSVESGMINLEINTKDKKSFKVALKSADKQTVLEMIRERIID